MFGNDSEILLDVSGRDDSLLKILAEKMNFKFTYIDILKLCATENETLPGETGLQMLQERVSLQEGKNLHSIL